MTITMDTPRADGLGEVVSVLGEWQHDGLPVQLHPGDVGWFCRFGVAATAGAVRTWRRDGRILAIGLQDESDVLRVAIAPDAEHDQQLAAQMLADVSSPERGVLPAGRVCIEARFGAAFHHALDHDGWKPDEPWTPLTRDLTDGVEPSGLRIMTTDREDVSDRVAVQVAAFEGSTFTEDAWRAVAGGPAYTDARCLVAYDEHDTAVAAVTVWSAGRGRPGLLEPMGVHRDHRGQGHGRAICLAAAAALRDLGSSSALVCTPTSNSGAVATYRSGGFVEQPAVTDWRRDA